MGAVLQFSVTVEYRCDCITCGTPIFLTNALYDQKKRDHSFFYCVNGHSQHWPQKSDLEILREQAEREKTRREWAEKERDTARKAAAIARGKLKATKERVGNGVCPCCNRTFQNLQRHMGTKHPGYKAEEA